MTAREFIDYWDKTIKKWAENDNVPEDGKVWFDDVYPKFPEGEKVWFEVNPKLKNWVKLMPEPYWGNPTECSVVILNYNPASSVKIDKSCDGHIGNKEDKTTSCGLMSEKYSEIAKSFPILDKHLKCPYKCFGGVRWWKGREKWIQQIIGIIKPEILKEDNIKPFALEICGWHSPSWNYIKIDDKIKNYLKQHLEGVIDEAINNSKVKIGLCIGQDFDKILKIFGFEEFKPKTYGVIYEEGKGYKPKENIKRWFRVYHKTGGSFILNTHSEGSNQPPSKDFETFERFLLNN